jgi:hypothetical protein
MLVAAVVAINAFTAWNLIKPEPPSVPKHRVLPVAETRDVLIKAAGEYKTGSMPGDRRLTIQLRTATHQRRTDQSFREGCFV